MLAEKTMPAAHAGEEQSSAAPGEFAARSAHLASTAAGIAAARAESQAAPAAAATERWSTASHDGFDAETLSNLILAHDWLRAGDLVYVGQKKAIALGDLVDAEDILLVMSERSTKLAGAIADGYPGVTESQKRILNAALRGWIALCCPPEFLGVENIRQHRVTDADEKAAEHAVIGGAE